MEIKTNMGHSSVSIKDEEGEATGGGDVAKRATVYHVYMYMPCICHVYHTYIMYTTHTPWKYS